MDYKTPLHNHTISIVEWREKLRRMRQRRQWKYASWRTKLWWFRQSAYRLLTAESLRKKIPEAWSNVQTYGPTIRDTYDTCLVQQFLQQCYIALRHNIAPSYYYTYRLYESDRWNRADRFLYESWDYHEQLLYELNKRSRPASERTIIDNKIRFFKHCKSHGLPTAPVVAAVKNGTVTFCNSPEGSLPKQDLFAKPAEANQGQGARQYVHEGGNWKIESHIFTEDRLLKQLEQESVRDNQCLIVQPRLRNHSSWQPYTSGALATVRLITGRRIDGGIDRIGAILRMPTGKSIVDNSHAGGIRAQIELPSGRLGRATTSLPKNGAVDFPVHPDTNHPIEGQTVPDWSEICKLGIGAHETFDTVFIGWDIAMTTEGPMLIEANNLWSSVTLEIPDLRLDRYTKVYDEWMQHLIG